MPAQKVGYGANLPSLAASLYGGFWGITCRSVRDPSKSVGAREGDDAGAAGTDPFRLPTIEHVGSRFSLYSSCGLVL